MRLVAEPSGIETHPGLILKAVDIVIEDEGNSMNHDEAIVIHELQANRRKACKETVTFDLVEVRVVDWIGIPPCLEFRM